MNINQQAPRGAIIHRPGRPAASGTRMWSTEQGLAILLCLALLGMSTPRTAVGQEFCSEPVAPYCVTTESEFDTMLQINRCNDDLGDYQEQIATYEQCIADQLQAMRQELTEARERLEEVEKDL